MGERLKTGTTTIGVVTKEGIILAADMRATAGNLIVNKKVEKVQPISDSMAMTWAGSVSEVQLLTKLVKAELQLKRLRTNREPTVVESANLLAGLVYRNIRQVFAEMSISHFLLAGKDNDGFHLYDIFPDGSVTEIDDFVSSGSGSVFAYGVLETLYNKDITLEEAKALVIRAVNAALQRDSASGGGITLYTITKTGLKKELSKEVGVDLTQ